MNEVGTKVASKSVEVSDLFDTMKTTCGRAVIWQVLKATGVFTETFSCDPYKHAYSAGKRSVGLWLLDELKNAAPSELNLLYRENDNG